MSKLLIYKFFVVFFAVTVNGQVSIYSYEDVAINQITSNVVEIDAEFFRISDLLFVNNKVLVIDKSNEPTVQIFKVVNDTTFRQVRSFGSKGRGPTEFIDPWEIFRSEKHNELYIFDAVNRRMAVLDENYELLVNDYINVKTDGFYTTMHRFDHHFIGTGITTGCMLEIFDANGERTECRGKQPDLGLKSKVSDRTVAQRWHSYSVISQSKNKAILFYRHAHRVRSIDLKGNLQSELIDKDFGTPITEAVNGNAIPAHVDFRAYISATSNDQFIYALYSGEISTSPFSYLGGYIHKFDWELNLIDIYKLDHLAINIHIDAEGNVYTIEYDPENNVRLLNIK